MQKTVEDILDAAGVLDTFKQHESTGDYIEFKVESAGYMPLTIRVVGEGRVTVCHHTFQNGDMMLDPEVTFLTQHNWKAVTFEDSFRGIYQVASEGEYIPGANHFAHKVWAKNLRHQGFVGQSVDVRS